MPQFNQATVTMEVSSDACDLLSERLVSLGIPSVLAISGSELNSSNICPRFLANCSALLRELGRYDRNISSIEDCTSLDQIFVALKSRSPYFSSNTKFVQFKLLQFLVAEIQVERLTGQAQNAHGADTDATEDEMEVEDDETYAQRVEQSVLAFQLDKICKLLYVPVDPSTARESGVEGVLEAVQRHVSSTLQQDPTLLSNQPSKILPEQLALNAQQNAKLAAVEEMLHKDFALRREMLIKRMEVTVESFLWSEKTSCRENEDEIRTAVRAQQEHLAAPPRRYQLIDALEANVALLHEQSKKITGDSQLANTYSHHTGSSSDSGGRMKSIIKQILIGSVPDRGGRANEVRPKQVRADVRRAFGGGGGGGGDRGNKRDKKGSDSAPAASSAPADNNSNTGKKGTQNKAPSSDGKGNQERSQSAPSNPANNNRNKNSNNNNNNANKSSEKSQGNASNANSGRKVEVQPTTAPATSSVQTNNAPQGQKKNEKPQNGGGGRKR